MSAESEDYRQTIDELVKELELCRGALEASREAMETWCALYAPDECTKENVEKAQKRISEGGTLWYIAITTGKIDEALSP